MIRTLCRRSIATVLVLATSLLIPVERARAQGDGPRAYQFIPDDSKIAALWGLFLRGNQSVAPGSVIPDGDIDVNLGIVQYTQSFGVDGKLLALFGVFPVGEVTGSVPLTSGTVSSSSSGISDIIVGSVLGLVGSPALAPKDYADFRPGFALGAMVKVLMPTGEYDADTPINLGSNRWAFLLGAPMTYYLGASMLDPKLTTFELVPSVWFYATNDDPFGAETRKQDPLLGFEGHITRNLNRMIWLSLDGRYVYGGGTTTDGTDDDNTQDAFGMAGTLGVAMSKSASLKVTYGEIAYRNDDGPDGSMVRLIAIYAF